MKRLLKRDKLSLDLFWIKDKSLTDTDALPAPDILAQKGSLLAGGLPSVQICCACWRRALVNSR
jgi:hypothetical protein